MWWLYFAPNISERISPGEISYSQICNRGPEAKRKLFNRCKWYCKNFTNNMFNNYFFVILWNQFFLRSFVHGALKTSPLISFYTKFDDSRIFIYSLRFFIIIIFIIDPINGYCFPSRNARFTRDGFVRTEKKTVRFLSVNGSQ